VLLLLVSDEEVLLFCVEHAVIARTIASTSKTLLTTDLLLMHSSSPLSIWVDCNNDFT